MPTARKGYKLADGTKAPSVTTILNRYKESGGLINWAYNCGRDGIDMRAVATEAASAGTLAHAYVDEHIHGRPVVRNTEVDPIIEARAWSAYETAFLPWWSANRVSIEQTEVYMVSERYRFGGTPDAIGRNADGKVVLLDWKTGNKVYSDALLQIAAYALLWEEETGQQVEQFMVCRFSKEHGDFSQRVYANLDEAKKCFLLLREAYDLDKQILARVG